MANMISVFSLILKKYGKKRRIRYIFKECCLIAKNRLQLFITHDYGRKRYRAAKK